MTMLVLFDDQTGSHLGHRWVYWMTIFIRNRNGEYGYIDYSGEIVIQARYFRANSFHEGFASVIVGDQFNFTSMYINKEGNVAVSSDNDYFGDFSEGLAAIGGRHGTNRFINKQGDTVIDLSNMNVEAQSFRNGVALLSGPGYLSYLINKKGNLIWNSSKEH